ncbi:MAG: DegV family EDD domain-containing protein, partial [Eubacterium sp.]|nr:DegV family EDD domain-containing protein [Eubacterium sp.]
LVVDDNVSNLMVVEKLLRDTKVRIDTAESGAEALEKMILTEYPVIFMDHLMPEMNGIECLHALREQTGGLCKESKVVALTANAGSENRALYEREGFDGYLLKPVSGQDLERELYRLLPRELIIDKRDEGEILEESIAWMHTRSKKIPIVITTESVADLPEEIVEKHHIGIIPHYVISDEGVFSDGIEIESRGLIAYMESPETHAETRAPDVMEHELFFADQLSRANNVIHISITSRAEHSGCIAATEAAKSFENVTVIDSAHLSSGQGLMAIEACRLAEAGYSVTEIVDAMEDLKKRVHTSFVVDDIDFLARSGQIHRRVAGFAKAFMIHPEIALKKGKMGVGNIFFGTRESVWKKYINSTCKKMKNADRRILFVTYVGLTLEEQVWIRERIEEREQFSRIIFQKASPAIAVNSGPGTFGVLYFTTE